MAIATPVKPKGGIKDQEPREAISPLLALLSLYFLVKLQESSTVQLSKKDSR